jgi:hypothetical protein
LTDKEFERLEAEKHAVRRDVIYRADGTLEEIRYEHYRTCVKCLQQREAR